MRFFLAMKHTVMGTRMQVNTGLQLSLCPKTVLLRVDYMLKAGYPNCFLFTNFIAPINSFSSHKLYA